MERRVDEMGFVQRTHEKPKKVMRRLLEIRCLSKQRAESSLPINALNLASALSASACPVAPLPTYHAVRNLPTGALGTQRCRRVKSLIDNRLSCHTQGHCD